MTLNFETSDYKSKRQNKTKFKVALGVGSAVGLFGIGSTLAGNITLNGPGNRVEFGQGIATTAACDEDGFTVTPVSFFDNNDSIFKVDYVQVSGVNLTPEGSGWNLASNPSYVDQAAAKLARPGQYYTGTEWKNTCDGVVLDFKAYTDESAYIDRTVIDDEGTPSLQNPIGWRQDHNPGEETNNSEPGFALVIDITDVGNFQDDSEGKNWAVDSAGDSTPYAMDFLMVGYSAGSAATSTFNFYVGSETSSADAASISKITVQSMSRFPSSYYAIFPGLGDPSEFFDAT